MGGNFYGEGVCVSDGQIDLIVGQVMEQVRVSPNPQNEIALQLGKHTAGLTLECQARIYQRLATVQVGKYELITREVMTALDDWGGNQLINLDSSDTFVAAFGNTAAFQISIQTDFRFLDAVVTDEVATKFGLIQLSVAAFSAMAQGFTVANNAAANPSLSLAIFTPAYDRTRWTPLLGRQYGAQTQVVIQAHELTGAPNRFLMGVLVQLQGICNPGRCVRAWRTDARLLS